MYYELLDIPTYMYVTVKENAYQNIHTQDPEPCTFSTRMDWVVLHGIRKLVQVKDTFQYIPLIGILQAMLQNQAIYKEVKS